MSSTMQDSMQTSLVPWTQDHYMPSATLLHYDDGSTIPVINFAPNSRFQVNLGALEADEAAAYLTRLSVQAKSLAEQIKRQAVQA